MYKFFITLLISLSATSTFALPKQDAAIKVEQAKMDDLVQAIRQDTKLSDPEKHALMIEQRGWEVQINNACTTDKSCTLASLARRNEYLSKIRRK